MKNHGLSRLGAAAGTIAGLGFLLYLFGRGRRPYRVIVPASEAALVQWIATDGGGMELV